MPILIRSLALALALAVAVPALAAPPAIVPAPAAPAAALAKAGPEVSTFTLPNGLEVVVIPDHRTPVVTHMLWYKVGAADEPAGKSGIAHFLEHLMFKGTKDNPSGIFSQIVARIGGQENAFTAADYTGYFQRTSREHLPRLMALEADRMTGLVLTDEVVLPELQVVLEEQNSRVANDPAARLGEQVAAALYLNHPYGRPIIGWRPEIEKLNRAEALAFYQRFYAPNNAVLVVAGDVTAEEVRKLAEETFGKVSRRDDIAPRQRPQEPPPAAVRSVTLSDPRVAQPSLQRSYLVPSESSAKDGESEAIDVLSHILNHGSVSRLYRDLVVDKRLASSVGGWYQSTALDDSRMAIYATPAAGVELSKLEAALDAALAEVVANGVTPEEMERAKSRMVADMVYAQDNQMTLARIYGAALTTGSTVERVQSWTDRIRQVTPEAVHAAAKLYLDKRRSVTGYLVPEGTPKQEGRRS